MIENGEGFKPRKVFGEIVPMSPAGKVVTRLYGELVFVSAREEGERLLGNLLIQNGN